MYPENYLKEIHVQLNEYLASINVLSIKVRNMHYNLQGVEFFDVHAKLDEYYGTISEEIDEIAERVRILDGIPDASMKAYLAKTKIQDIDSKIFSYEEVCQKLVADFQTIVKFCHKVIKFSSEHGDEGTADIFTKNIQFYEKAVWMLKALYPKNS